MGDQEVFAIRPVYHDTVLFKKDVSEYRDWYFDFYNLDEMHRKGFTGRGVNVAVGDTGVPRHDDIIVYHGEDMRYGYHPTMNDGKYDRDQHSTHVCGIIAAQHNGFGTRGVAPHVNLHVGKELNDDGGGTISDLIRGGDRHVELGVKIKNLSIGINAPANSKSVKDLYEAITRWYEKGMICICAAGNDGEDDGLDFPGSHPLTICAGSHDNMGNRSSFSDKGDFLDVYGAGDRVLSTYNNNEYQIMSGTSQAAPFVTGMIAAYYDVLILKYGRLTVEMIGDLVSKKLTI